MDPVWWIREFLGVELWAKQREIVESVRDNRITAVKSCHSAGKSRSAACVVLWYLYNHIPCKVLSTAPTDTQVKDILWSDIRALHTSAPHPLGGELQVQNLIINHDHWAKGYTAKNPTNFQGRHSDNVLIVVDEAMGVDEQIFNEGVTANMASGDVKLLMIGNPTSPQGSFFDAFKPKSNAHKISVNGFDTPNLQGFGITPADIVNRTWREKVNGRPLPAPYLINPQYIEDMDIKNGDGTLEGFLSHPVIQGRVLAQFPQQGEDSLIPLFHLERAKDHYPKVQPNPKNRPIIAVDVARFGGDESVIAARWPADKNILKVIDTRVGVDTVELAELALRHAIRLNAQCICVDTIGVGAGVYDYLNHNRRIKEFGIKMSEAIASAAASDPSLYINARAQWFDALRTDYKEDMIAMAHDEKVEDQLARIKYKFTITGKMQIERKEDMKKRGFESPDRADAFAMTYANESAIDIVVI